MPREAPKGETIRIHLYNISLVKVGGHISILISCLSGRYTYVLRNQDTVVVMKGM